MEIIGGIQVSGSIDIYEGVLRTIEASGSFSGSGYDLYDIQAEAIVGLVSLKTGSVTASVNQTNGFVVNSAISGSTFTGSVRVISGSFSGSGAQLYDIPFSSLTGDSYRIASGSATASLAINASGSSSLHINTNTFITGALWVSGGMEIFGDVTIYGTQSVEYITSSQLNIGTNIITVNTDTPALRFGGLAVYDSGSTGRTGSLLWDSQRNNWIYTNPSGSAYDGGVVLMGPTNASGSGNEQTINQYAVAIGEGSHHLTSSALIVSESKFISSIDTIISESLSITGSLFMNTSNIYVNQPVSGTNIFGTASHADSSSYTLLAQTANVMDGGIY
jgi:hypothetical protein